MNKRTLFYVDDFTDEVIPCDPTLAAWATWMSGDAPGGPPPFPILSGDEFNVSSIEVLAEVEVEMTVDGWRPLQPLPDAATYFFVMHGPGLGWDAEQSGPTLEIALTEEDEAGPHWIACTRDGPTYRYRYEVASGQPALVAIGPVT